MALRLSEPGFHLIPEGDYHADPAAEPSLSHSIIRVLIEQSPRHARAKHPRLNPDMEPSEPTAAMEAGTVLHHLILGGGSAPVVVAADDWRKQASKDARDTARAFGRVPVLHDHYVALARCAAAVLSQIRDHPQCGEFSAPGRSEVTMLWREMDAFWCRALVDRLPDADAAPLFDLKSVATPATADKWPRLIRSRYGTQAAFYLRGARALGRRPREQRFILFEREPPYCIHVAVPGQTAIEKAEEDIKGAVMKWLPGILADEWPGISTEAEYWELPPHEGAGFGIDITAPLPALDRAA